MEYRRLGRTGLDVSVLGIGCGYLSLLEHGEGARILDRAFELGINYFDGRYGDSSSKLRPLLARHRDRCVVVTKTSEFTAEGAQRRVEEDLEELGSDYIDIFLLRTYNREMLEQHLAPGGSMEGVQRARQAGKVRFAGLSGHTDLVALADGIRTDLVDVVLFPLNIVRREALELLVPAAQEHNVGLTIMKPLQAGIIPPHIALPWLANQPIHTMVPGVSTMEHLEANFAAIQRGTMALTAEEEAEVERWRQDLDHVSCRICDHNCHPVCEPRIYISGIMHHDVWLNHFRQRGVDAFMESPWAGWAKKGVERHFEHLLAAAKSCTHCGTCEQCCPHHFPIMNTIEALLESLPPLIDAVKKENWTRLYEDAASPYKPSAARS